MTPNLRKQLLLRVVRGAVVAAILWFVLNRVWTVNNVGLIERTLPFPLRTWWMWALGGSALGVGRFIHGRRRMDDLKSWANELGETLRESVPREELGDLNDFGLFDDWHAAHNYVCVTLESRRCEVFEYTSVQTGEDTTYRTQTVVLFPDLELSFPPFQLHCRGYIVGLARMMSGIMGLQIVGDHNLSHRDAEIVARFNGRYALFPASIFRALGAARGKGSQPNNETDRLAALWSIDLLRFFADHPGWCVESTGSGLAIWKPSRIVPPADRRALLDDAAAIVEALAQASETPPTEGIRLISSPIDEPTVRRSFHRFAACVMGGFLLGGAVGMTAFFKVGMSDDAFGKGPWLLAVFFVPIVVGTACGAALAAWLSRRR